MSRHPRLDPKRVMRIYKRLDISSVEELRGRLESGEIAKLFGSRMEQHIRQGLTETHAMLLYRADDLRETVEEFLLGACAVRRAEAAGEYWSSTRWARPAELGLLRWIYKIILIADRNTGFITAAICPLLTSRGNLGSIRILPTRLLIAMTTRLFESGFAIYWRSKLTGRLLPKLATRAKPYRKPDIQF